MITKLRSSPSQVNFNFISEPSGLAPTKQLAFHPNVGEASLRACRNHKFGVAIDGFLQCSRRISWGWNQETWIFRQLKFWSRASCEGRSVSGIFWNMGRLQRTTIDCGYQTASIVWKSTRNSPNSPIHPGLQGLLSISRKDRWRFLSQAAVAQLPSVCPWARSQMSHENTLKYHPTMIDRACIPMMAHNSP